MVGKSHSMLGALGFLASIPVAQLDVEQDVLIYSTVGAGLLIPLFVYIPSGIQAQRNSDTYFIDITYKFIYRVLAMPYLILLFAVVLKWLYIIAPQVFPKHPAEIVVWTLVAAGWANVPDLDEPKSTIANYFGSASEKFSRFTRKVSGGHRNATHSWILVVISIGLSLLSIWFIPLAAVIVAVSFVFAIRVMLPEKAYSESKPIMLTAALVGVLIVFGSMNIAPIVLAVPLGILLHDLGDWFTRGGIKFWYPYNKKYGAGIMYTNSWSEIRFIQPLMRMGILIMLAYLVAFPVISDPTVLDSHRIMENYYGVILIEHNQIIEFVKSAKEQLTRALNFN